MKLVTAIIKPFKLIEVRAALILTGVLGVTVPRIKRFARQMECRVIYRDVVEEGICLPKVRIEVIVAELLAGAAIAVNRRKALTTRIATGQMYMPDLSYILRVRTGDIEEAAL
jgi:nitrogen regulatory protein PII